MIKTEISQKSRVGQGDIYKEIEMVEEIQENDGNLFISKIEFPFVIVLTQDCDLERDYFNRKDPEKDQDKFLFSVLVAPFFNEEHFRDGEHLDDLGIKMRKFKWNGTEASKIKKNQIPRYHYLEFPDNIPIVNSIIDFKHFFSVNISFLDKIRPINFECSISELFREDISNRFAFYLSRIALPDISKE